MSGLNYKKLGSNLTTLLNATTYSFIKEKKNETVGGNHIISERVWIFHLY